MDETKYHQETATIAIQMPRTTYDHLKKVADEADIPVQTLVLEAVVEKYPEPDVEMEAKVAERPDLVERLAQGDSSALDEMVQHASGPAGDGE